MTSEQEYDETTGEVHEGQAVRSDQFAMTETRAQNETAAMAVASRVQAMVQARFVIALKHPRQIDDVRTSMLRECDRPGFADVARYKRPVGKKKNPDTGEWEESFAEGPSIRFVEAAVRLMGNLGPGVTVLYDDAQKRILRCEVIDYETGSSWDREITIEKTVERRQLKKGQQPIRSRRNSYGDTVYVVEAEPGELAVREGAEVSKCLRVLAQRLIPGDIVEECMTRVLATQIKRDAADPAAARKALVDRFAAIGVRAVDLQEYLGGRPLDGATPDQLVELRAVGAALKDGEGTWAQALETSPYRTRSEGPAAGGAATSAPVSDPKAQALRDKIEKTSKAARDKRAGKPSSSAQAPQGAPGSGSGWAQAPAQQTPPQGSQREPGED